MGRKDYYRILGVPRSASTEDIRKAYRRLARRHHPDRNEGDPRCEERLKEINEAYAVLGDPDKKRHYDRSMGARVPVRVVKTVEIDQEDLDFWDDPFRSLIRNFWDSSWRFFSEGSYRKVPEPHEEEVFWGGKRSAGVKGADVQVHITVSEQERVRGVEKDVVYRCGERLERVTVRIPAGAVDGTCVRMAGRGEESPWGGPPGDLRVVIRVSKKTREAR